MSMQHHIRSLGQRLERTRLLKNISQAALADLASISERTLRRLESGEGGSLNTLVRVLMALELDDNLMMLIPDYAVRPMERIRETKTERRRASSSTRVGTAPNQKDIAKTKSKAKPGSKTDWAWGDEQK